MNAHDILSVSVVIPSIQETQPKELDEALARQTLPATEILHIHDKDRRGAAWARNRGIEKAVGHIVAFIDDDCIPPDDWLATIVETMVAHDADVVGGTYTELDSFLNDRRLRQRYPDQTGPDEGGRVGAGGNIAYRMTSLLQTRWRDGHFFDESFRISQDYELLWRVRRRGARVVYMAKPVLHTKSMGAFEYLRQQFGRGAGIAGLNRTTKSLGNDVTTHQSLLWSDPDASRVKIILKVLWHKGIGPFDWRSFSSFRNFMLFWAGEKVQGLGFLWAVRPRVVARTLERSRGTWQTIIARPFR